MSADIERWLKGKGEAFLRDIGIGKGQRMLDFGCGAGHYSVPAAKVVGRRGSVYALDKDAGLLEKMRQAAQSEGVANIIPILDQSESLEAGLESGSMDAILMYDVLHYMEPGKRRLVYERAHALLKTGGVLSVYPKHCKSDEPLWNLADTDMEEISREIESAGFILERKLYRKLVHDEGFDKGYILNFRKEEE